MSARDKSRRAELQADRATVGLSEREARELRALGAGPDELADPDQLSYEVAAAAAHLALLDKHIDSHIDDRDDMPELLGKRVENQAKGFFAGRADSTDQRRPASSGWRPSWQLVAAASACAAAALVALWLTRNPTGAGPDRVARSPRAPAPAEMRAALLARADDTLRWPWQATEDASARTATGDVVWSDAAQTGYMRIRGLQVNDPRQFQYQLWIFDPARDERYPVDGGVFDIAPGTDEVIVAIDARLPVRGPTLFAVTVERPGGVVVSTRERIALVAQAAETRGS